MACTKASVGACNGNGHEKEVCSKLAYAQGMGEGHYRADTWSEVTICM